MTADSFDFSGFARLTNDLYPGRYQDPVFVKKLEATSSRIRKMVQDKDGIMLAHYYTYPEIQETAHMIGDSLALSNYARTTNAKIIYFQGVAFMAQTAKILNPPKRVFISDSSTALGCSLVFGTDHAWIEAWKKQNSHGLVVCYINSDPYTKALSDFESTSRNTDKVLIYILKNYPDRKILFLPDKFLGNVMKTRALRMLAAEGIQADPDLIEIYDWRFNGFNASCQVHEPLGSDAIIVAMLENPDAEVIAHPECGCTPYCLLDPQQNKVIQQKVSFLSTEQMIKRALESESQKFIIATEAGLIYTLRKKVPNKTFVPVSTQAVCPYMKANDLDKLEQSVIRDVKEVIICDNCANCRISPQHYHEDNRVIHIPHWIADKAREGIERMLAIQ